MNGDYPSNYYALRRVLHQQIKDKLLDLENKAKTGAIVDREEVILEIKIFAKELSNNSGVPIKGIAKLFQAHNIHLDIKTVPSGEV
jgi:hypothetical protein